MLVVLVQWHKSLGLFEYSVWFNDRLVECWFPSYWLP